MVEIMFPGTATEGRILTLAELQQKVRQITVAKPGKFGALKKTPGIDRALPRLVVAAVLTEAFGYPSLELTERELGSGLIIEAGMKKP